MRILSGFVVASQEHAIMSEAIVVQQPSDGPAEQLVLLFHGVGADAPQLVPLGRVLGAEFPQAFIVSVAAPDACDLGSGRQWFSLRGVTEENRPARVDAAMPRFDATVRNWQLATKVGIDATALVGFSQGGIMALESTRDRPTIAGRVIAIAGRFAQLPQRANADVTLHLIHGKADAVIPYAHAVQAAQRVVALGGDVTADVLPFVGHEINAQIASLLIERLRGYLPRRRWEEALRAAPPLPAEDEGEAGSA
jgi:phospholipase/carboxylesterase